MNPHEIVEGGNFDPKLLGDPSPKYRPMREYIYQVLRKPDQENAFKNTGRTGSKTDNKPLMPLLSGDNPLSNTLPSKFLKLTDYQLFILRQWNDGKFINDCKLYIDENGNCPPRDTHLDGCGEGLGRRIDRGVLGNMLGGSFCPGGEVGWIMRNPAIYKAPFQLNVNLSFVPSMNAASALSAAGSSVYDADMSLSQTGNLSSGLEPGDLTKYMALPWQSDFNECSTQDINVTYTEWNQIYPKSTGDDYAAKVQMNNTTLWWPAHRPMQVILRTTNEGTANQGTANEEGTDPPTYSYSQYLDWSYGIPQTNAGDLKMVQAWKELGFVISNTDTSSSPLQPYVPYIVDGDEPSNLNHDDPAEFGGE